LFGQVGNLLVAAETTGVPGRQLQDEGEGVSSPLNNGLQQMLWRVPVWLYAQAALLTAYFMIGSP